MSDELPDVDAVRRHCLALARDWGPWSSVTVARSLERAERRAGDPSPLLGPSGPSESSRSSTEFAGTHVHPGSTLLLMTDATVLPPALEPRLDDGSGSNSDDNLTHIVRKSELDRSHLDGSTVTALCGKRWTPNRTPNDAEVCVVCRDLYHGIKNDHPDARIVD